MTDDDDDAATAAAADDDDDHDDDGGDGYKTPAVIGIYCKSYAYMHMQSLRRLL